MFSFFFAPKSIAVIGASRQAHTLGNDLLKNLKRYHGRVYPVNPKAQKILGLKCYSSILDIPEKVDLAVIIVPAPVVEKVTAECAKKRVRGVVVISAGFKEIGEIEREEKLKKFNLKLIGPNCLGIINLWNNLNASFAGGCIKKGNVGLISQSGAMAVAILDWACRSKIGFSKIISIGNKAGLNENDFLKYLGRDEQTKVIMMYLESIERGFAFMELAKRIARRKPIIVLKAGESPAAKKAVASHTGVLAGSQEAVEAAFHEAGIIQARTIEDLFDFAEAFSLMPLMKNNRLAIVTNAGGPAVMATDALARTKLKLAPLKNNPFDLRGDALAKDYGKAIRTILKNSRVDGLLVILTPQTMTEEDKTAEIIGRLKKKISKPIISSFMGGKDIFSAWEILEKYGVPNYLYPERAVRAMSRLYQAHLNKKIRITEYRAKIKKIKFDTSRGQLRTSEAEKLLLKYKLPILKSLRVEKFKEFQSLRVEKFPIVMKLVSRDVIHKKAAGVLRLNIKNRKEAKQAWQEIMKKAKKYKEKEGMLIQPMVAPGIEVIIGAKRDPAFGPLILFGLGGSFVEIMKDIAIRIAPCDQDEAAEMLREIKGWPLLKTYDLKFITNIIIKVSHLMLDYPEIQELDLNPVIVHHHRGKIVDVRILV